MVACNENAQTRLKGHTPESEVPLEVRKAFSNEYPGATDVEWRKLPKADSYVYEVEYKYQNKEWENFYNQEGKVIRKELD